MPTAPIYSVDDYLSALQKLMPRGPVWQTDPNSIQAKTERGLVTAWWRVNVSDAQLLVDAFPASAVGLLPEWEETLGLPDPCAGEAPTIAARQLLVVAKLTNSGGQSVQYFIDLAESLGYSITITQGAPFRAGQSHAGDPLAGPDAQFIWYVNAPLATVHYFRAGASHAGEPLATWGNAVLECAILALAPAHTHVIFTYGNDIPEGFGVDFATGKFYSRVVGGPPVSYANFTDLFTFTRATVGTYRDTAGVLRTAGINVPRMECAGDGSLLGLWMEATRTNLALQSQAFDDAVAWNNNNAATVTPNATLAPDGTLTADKLVEGATNDNHFLGQVVNFTSGLIYTWSCFVKAAERGFAVLQMGGALGGGATTFYNLATGAVSGLQAGSTAGAEKFGNGWWRLWMTRAATATSGSAVRVWSASDVGSPYLGDGASGVYVWGAQCEAGPALSSYIPTLAATVARDGDYCVRNTGGEVNQAAGTVVFSGRFSKALDPTLTQRIWALSDGTDTERIHLSRNPTLNVMRFAIADGGVTQALFDNAQTDDTSFKDAAAWALNDIAESHNGGAVQTDNAGTMPTTVQCTLGCFSTSQQMNGTIKSFAYYATRKSNAELQALST